MPVSKVMYALLFTGMKVRLWARSGCWDYDCCWMNFELCRLELLFQYFWLLHQIFFFLFLARWYFYVCNGISPSAAAATDNSDNRSSFFKSTLSNKEKCIYSGHVEQKVKHYWMMQVNSFLIRPRQQGYLLIRSIVLCHSVVPIKLFPSVAQAALVKEIVCVY